jgi:hypothetical protein
MPTDVVMSAQDWIWIICLGGLAGALGQIARIVIGLKKANEEAADAGAKLKEVFETNRMVISIVIGATAGALAAITVKPDLAKIGTETIVALAGAGYSGADFIEGLMSKQLNRMSGGGAAGAGAITTSDGYLA